jgi:glycosyltransferase involved in cell wall biosynthesis
MRIHLKIPVGSFTGYGRDGIELTRVFLEHGHDVTLTPVSCNPPIPPEVAHLLTKYPSYPQDLTIHHLSPDQLGIHEHQVERSHLNIAWTMWEFLKFGPTREDSIKQRLENYDHVYVYDETSYSAISELRPEGVSILQGGYAPDFWRSTGSRDYFDDQLRLCMAGALGPRKDPYVAAEAVRQLRDEGLNVHLTLKCSTPHEIHPMFDVAYKDSVTVVRDTWPDSTMKELYENSHIYLATSWGEGKNLPALEAGTTGCALLLSDCGGHRQWGRSSDFATLMKGDIQEHEVGLPSVRMDVEVVKCHIKELYENRTKLREMGEAAAVQLPREMSWEAVVQRLYAQLNTLK